MSNSIAKSVFWGYAYANEQAEGGEIMFFKGLRRLVGLLNGDVETLKGELRKKDSSFAHQEAQNELVRMREVARRWDIGPSDHAYPDIWYVQGSPPTYE